MTNSFIQRLNKALGHRSRELKAPLHGLQPCPFHPKTEPTLQVFHDARLFRCYRCCQTFNVVELLRSVHSDPEQAIALAQKHHLLENGVSAAAVLKRMRYRESLLKMFDRGRRFFHSLLVAGEIANRFGDVGLVERFELEPFVSQSRLPDRVQRFYLRIIRNIFGRIVSFEYGWNPDYWQEERMEPLQWMEVYAPRWTDSKPFNEVILTHHPSIGLGIALGMSFWKEDQYIPILVPRPTPKKEQPIYRPPFDRIWCLTREENFTQVFKWFFGGQADLRVKNLQGKEVEEIGGETDAPEKIFKKTLSLEGYLHLRLHNLDRGSALELVRRIIRNSQPKGDVYRKVVEQAAFSMKRRVEDLIEDLDPVPGCFDYSTAEYSYYCRQRVYWRKKKRHKPERISNFSVKVLDQTVEGTHLIWKLLLIVNGRSTELSVHHYHMERGTRLWKELCLAAARSRLDPPVCHASVLKKLLPNIIKSFHCLT